MYHSVFFVPDDSLQAFFPFFLVPTMIPGSFQTDPFLFLFFFGSNTSSTAAPNSAFERLGYRRGGFRNPNPLNVSRGGIPSLSLWGTFRELVYMGWEGRRVLSVIFLGFGGVGWEVRTPNIHGVV